MRVNFLDNRPSLTHLLVKDDWFKTKFLNISRDHLTRPFVVAVNNENLTSGRTTPDRQHRRLDGSSLFLNMIDIVPRKRNEHLSRQVMQIRIQAVAVVIERL